MLRNVFAVALASSLLARGARGARLWSATLGICAALAPNPLQSAAANGDTRTIHLFHSHSKESITATFRSDGHYNHDVLEKLNWFLRDWRNDETTKMDPRLFDVLWEAYRSSGRNGGPDDPIVVVSAYRCPATNAMLRRRSRAVAKNSQHMLGKAMDTTMPGLSMEKLREIGMRMQRGGVGYYPTAGTPFVHLDVGGVRHWPRMNYDQLARLFPDGKTVHLPSNGKPLPGYEEARAEILARGGEAVTVAEANSTGGGIRGFFASLFGGGGEEEEESAPVMRPTRGGTPVAVASAEDGESDESAPAPRRLVASAEANLPRGETFMGAPARESAVMAPREAVASVAPAAKSAGPTPEAQPAMPAALAHAPQPPRRPDDLLDIATMPAVLALAPLPPRRPAEFAALPDLIAHGRKPELRGAAPDAGALAYAAPAPSAAPQRAEPANAHAPAKPLRAAALGKAEESRAAKSAAAQMAPARADRAALASLITAAPPTGRPAAGFAPPLRAAARADVFAAAPTTPGQSNRFSDKATQLPAHAFAAKAQ